jgi:hypothetical protein
MHTVQSTRVKPCSDKFVYNDTLQLLHPIDTVGVAPLQLPKGYRRESIDMGNQGESRHISNVFACMCRTNCTLGSKHPES